MSAFARERGLNIQRVAYWRDRIEGVGPAQWGTSGSAAPRLLPAVVVGNNTSGARVLFPAGVVIEVERLDAVSTEWIAALTVALARQS